MTTLTMLSDFAWDQRYRVFSLDDVLTPALLLYPDVVASKVERTLELLGGDANRWRVHIKTQSWPTRSACWSSVASAISNARPLWNCWWPAAAAREMYSSLIQRWGQMRGESGKSPISSHRRAFPPWPRTNNKLGNGAAAGSESFST
jgi:hypothetical protein